MVIKDEIMAKVTERENRQRCIDARLCPECGSDLVVVTETNGCAHLECCVLSCGFNSNTYVPAVRGRSEV